MHEECKKMQKNVDYALVLKELHNSENFGKEFLGIDQTQMV